MVTLSLKKSEILIIRGALFDSIKSSKSEIAQELMSLILDKLERFVRFARGETKKPAKKSAKRKKK